MQLRNVLAAVLCLGLAATAWGFALEPPIGFGVAHGGAGEGSGAAPVPLTQNSFLVKALGPDATSTTADDQMLLVRLVDGAPAEITPLATPFLSGWSQHVERISATRALVAGAGPDATFYSADDVVYLLDGLGTSNSVTTIPVGPLSEYDYSQPVALRPDLAVLAGIGPDFNDSSADDTLVVISNLGAGNTVTTVPAPEGLYIAQPVPFGTSTVVMGTQGPDSNGETVDDGVYVFTDVGGANTRTTVPAGYLIGGKASLAARITPTRALLVGEGPTSGSVDDQVFILDDIGGANTITPLTVPNLQDWSAATPQLIAPNRVVMATDGPDGVGRTADDGIVILSDIGGSNTQTPLTLGYHDDTIGAGPVPLSSTTLALPNIGPDGTDETADDAVWLVSDVGGANSVTQVSMPGLDEGITTRPVAIHASELVMASGGSIDPDIGAGFDEVVSRVLGIGTAPLTQAMPDGGITSQWDLEQRLALLGGGRGVYVTGGVDETIGTPDDQMRVLQGLDIDRSLQVDKVSIKSSAKGEKASVTATLMLNDLPVYFGHADVTISIGNAAETIPATEFVDKGKKVEFKAPKGSAGLVSKLTYTVAKSQLKVKAGGTGTGLETTMADFVPVAIEFKGLDFQETYLAEAVVGTQKGSKISYKRPKD